MFYFEILFPKLYYQDEILGKYFQHFKSGFDGMVKGLGADCRVVPKTNEVWEVHVEHKHQATNFRQALIRFSNDSKAYFEEAYGTYKLPRINLSSLNEERKRPHSQAFMGGPPAPPKINFDAAPAHPPAPPAIPSALKQPILKPRRKSVCFAENLANSLKPIPVKPAVKPPVDLRATLNEKKRDGDRFTQFDELFKGLKSEKAKPEEKILDACKIIIEYQKENKEVGIFIKRLESLTMGLKNVQTNVVEDKIRSTFTFENKYIAKYFQEKLMKHDFKNIEKFGVNDLKITFLDPILENIEKIVKM